MARDEHILRCSFCGKSQDEVEKLIGGPGGVCICDECVELCDQIIQEDIEEKNEVRHKQALRDAKPLPKPQEIKRSSTNTSSVRTRQKLLFRSPSITTINAFTTGKTQGTT